MAIREIFEALETRKFDAGLVKFSKSQWQDPHVRTLLTHIAQATGKSEADIISDVEQKLLPLQNAITKAPILYSTIKDNVIENEMFNLLWATEGKLDQSPEFRERTFFKLVRTIAAEHDEFWPLRSYLDGRRLQPRFEFVDDPMNGKGITTAAATPDGVFIFNIGFCQKLLDYAVLKQIKPKGRKYECNGGDIPDGYAYIEFLVLHEFMHYTNDDFHYQKMIPNANPKIINWVGDFRSNYLLVKSGYEQLPIGLYNDHINYDRQTQYIDMYNLVKQEMEALQDPQDPQLEKLMQDILDSLGDDHDQGQQQGAESETGEGSTTEDIDKASGRVEEQMKEGEDLTSQEASEKAGQSAGGAGGSPGTGGKNSNVELDYNNIRPQFNWQGVVKRFMARAVPRVEETYSKPSRRSVSSLETARQVGAAALKPGEKISEFKDVKVGFCIDSSGSMSSVIGTVMANAANLLKQPAFKYAQAAVIKFSSTADMFYVNFNQNKAAKVNSFKDKPGQYNLTVDDVFGVHFGAGTVFSANMADEIIGMIKHGYNFVFFFDDDIMAKHNLEQFLRVMKAQPANVFVIFDRRQTYVKFRQAAGVSTPNITHF